MEINDYEEVRRTIGMRISELLTERDLSEQELAEEIGCEESVIRQVEAGRTDLTLNTLYRIAQALHVPVNRLLL